MFERFSPDATKAILLAQQEARSLGRNYIDTEILLLGLIGVALSAARSSPSVITSLKSARKALKSVIGQGSDFVSRDPPFMPPAQEVVEEAAKEVRRGKVTSELIFRMLLRETQSDAVQILASLSVDLAQITDALKSLSEDVLGKAKRRNYESWFDDEDDFDEEEEEDDEEDEEDEDWYQEELEPRAYTREGALYNVFGLNNFIKRDLVPAEMLSWCDVKDKVLGCYINAEDDLLVIGRLGLYWYDGAAITSIEYKFIDSVEAPANAEDPYIRLTLRPKGKVVLLPVLNSTEGFPDYVDICEYLSFCSEPKARKMDIQDIQSKNDLIYFLRQPTVQTAGFEELAGWLESGGLKPSWLSPFNINPNILSDANVWKLFALMLVRTPQAAEKE